jgi:hypothetical protein
MRMLRIEMLHGDGDRATLGLEGRVIGPWVEELRAACDRILATGSSLTLDLAQVAFVAHDGAWLLKRLVDSGVTVVKCPAFVREQLAALSR